MDASGKPLVWLHGRVKSPPFSSEARIEAGVLLRRLQQGARLSMPHSKPMPGIGPGCHELRIPDKGAAWRIIHFIDTDAIVILEVFDKKTGKTPLAVVSNCQRRLSMYQASR